MIDVGHREEIVLYIIAQTEKDQKDALEKWTEIPL